MLLLSAGLMPYQVTLDVLGVPNKVLGECIFCRYHTRACVYKIKHVHTLKLLREVDEVSAALVLCSLSCCACNMRFSV